MPFDHFLTDAELSHLERLNGRLQIVKDRTRGVAEGHYNGFYLWGNGGIGKSFTVLEELNRIGKPYVLKNTRNTAKGLFELSRTTTGTLRAFSHKSLQRFQEYAK